LKSKAFFFGRNLSKSIFVSAFFCISLIGCSKGVGGYGSGDGTDGSISDQDLALSEQQRWGDGNIPQAQADGLFKDIMFGYDSSEIPAEGIEQLKQNAQVLIGDPVLHAEVEGHCDKRGTNEYNLALGEQRARSVATLLVSYGVKAEQLSTVSYGEEIPIDPADSEDAYAKNRRVHFALYKKNQPR